MKGGSYGPTDGLLICHFYRGLCETSWITINSRYPNYLHKPAIQNRGLVVNCVGRRQYSVSILPVGTDSLRLRSRKTSDRGRVLSRRRRRRNLTRHGPPFPWRLRSRARAYSAIRPSSPSTGKNKNVRQIQNL
jgi:hypothetical protein